MARAIGRRDIETLRIETSFTEEVVHHHADALLFARIASSFEGEDGEERQCACDAPLSWIFDACRLLEYIGGGTHGRHVVVVLQSAVERVTSDERRGLDRCEAALVEVRCELRADIVSSEHSRRCAAGFLRVVLRIMLCGG